MPTRLTDLEVKNLTVTGTLENTGLDADDYTVTSADAAAAASTAPTAAEFKKTVDLCNELKTKLNALVETLSGE